MDNPLDRHLEDIQHGSDLARALELVCYGVALILVVFGISDFFLDHSDRGWWPSTQGGIQFYFLGFALGYVRKVTITIIKIVEELRTTV